MKKILLFSPSKSERCGIWTYSNYLLNAFSKIHNTSFQLTMNKDDIYKMDYDLLHIQHEYGIVSQKDIEDILKINIPFIITLHTVWRGKFVEHELYKHNNCKWIIVHSEEQKKHLLSTCPILKDKIKIIPHISHDPIKYTIGKRENIKKIRIGAFGFSSFAKRFIDTFNVLKQTDIDFEYVVLSSYQITNNDSINYNNLLTKLKVEEDDLAQKENRETRLQLNNKFLDEDEILDILSYCDILTSMVIPITAPSVSGSSRFLMQAVKPVIVTDVYHYSDIPKDTFIKIHPSLSPLHLQIAIKEAMDNYERYQKKILNYIKYTNTDNSIIPEHLKLYI